MNWLDCSDRMDQYVIKKDGTSVDIEYFMATHVPFKDLEFLEFGDTESKPTNLDETQIYDKYIVNRANKHQMLIVRGTNGTGKSHLICWLHDKFVNDKVNYNSSKEKVIFLRRLGNTVRGAVQQMLDEEIINDPDIKEKFRRFCEASESQNENEYKATIYNEFVKRVQTDLNNDVFKQAVRKDIAAFLYDSRVQEHMMRPDGPVDRCYQMVTSGAKTMVTEETETVFTIEDFSFPKNVANSIKRNAAEEVKSYYLYELRDEPATISRLVTYLNKFTSKVMQSCANISSENVRSIFEDLRKSLYKEGKNLTIFIEDFTSFSIVESELITALAVENGGKNANLCRVNSIIGITDGYYDSIRDNFKDRVTKQIKVTEQSYGGESFLLEMAARYINAIYCAHDSVKEWYLNNTGSSTIPKPEFMPSFEWDSVEIEGVKYTLYPFNRKSLMTLYDKLKHKSPRYYLTYIIQHFFAQFADGMEFGDGWRFPEMPPFISSVTLQPPYADSVENSACSSEDKQRMKVLFSIWGDGTTEVRNNAIGGIHTLFLKDIGLENYKGVNSGVVEPEGEPKNDTSGNNIKPEDPVVVAPKLSKEELSFIRKKEDVESWFEEKKTLEYASDYNKWVGNFVAQTIPWQDEGLPGDFVTQRLRNGSFVYIEDSKLDTNKNKAIVVLNRTSEVRTLLMGLTLFDYYKNWDFENAAYYQFMMITWLEKNKQIFKDNLFGDTVGTKEHPVITWCIAIEYLQRMLKGEKVNRVSKELLLQQLMSEKTKSSSITRTNKDWNDVLTFLKNQASVEKSIHGNLVSGSKTIMGIIGESSSGKVPFYRTSELLMSLEHLEISNWDISKELSSYTSKQHENIRNYLTVLYDKVIAVVNSEKKRAKTVFKEFEDLLGKNPSEEGYVNVVSAIQTFYVTCGTAHEPFKSELKIKFESAPIEQAQKAIGYYELLKKTQSMDNPIDLLHVFVDGPIEELNQIIGSLKDVEKFALTLKEKHSKLLGGEESIDPLILEAALDKLEELSNRIEEMEAIE